MHARKVGHNRSSSFEHNFAQKIRVTMVMSPDHDLFPLRSGYEPHRQEHSVAFRSTFADGVSLRQTGLVSAFRLEDAK